MLMSFSPAGNGVSTRITQHLLEFVCPPVCSYPTHWLTRYLVQSNLLCATWEVMYPEAERTCGREICSLHRHTHTDSRVLQHTPPALTLSEISVEKTFSFSSQVNTLMQKKVRWHVSLVAYAECSSIIWIEMLDETKSQVPPLWIETTYFSFFFLIICFTWLYVKVWKKDCYFSIIPTLSVLKLGMHRLTGQRSEPAGFCL